MQTYTLDQLALLSEEKALQKHFDRLNYRWLRWLWRASFMTAFILFTTMAVEGDLPRLGVAALWLVVLFAMYLARTHERYEENFTEIVTGYILFAFAAILYLATDDEFRLVFTVALIPPILLFFRLPTRYYMTISAIFVAAAIALATSPKKGSDLALTITTNLLFAGVAIFLNRQARNAFLPEWRRVASQEKERERMREELADARKIQLAMLPAAPPVLDWLEIASLSLPATEVGGDFFDHFVMPDGRVAIAIGDVAGHGVGSGLVLAGIKSGLHLLSEELGDPAFVLNRLNRLSGEWLQWRMLVTLLIAVIDRDAKTVRVVSAGHEPLLLVSASGEIRSIGKPALPLGTKLPPQWQEDSAPLQHGDTLFFYTDGITELTNAAGEQHGYERLHVTLRHAAASHASAEAMRDPILSDLSFFKNGAVQQDDVSFVIARFRGE